MANNQVEQFLKALSENEEVRAYRADYALPEGVEKEDALVDIAAHFGYEITKDDLVKACEKQAGELAAVRQVAEKEVRELSVNDLDNVAGGGIIDVKKEHDECRANYKNEENCWLVDGCDINIYMYTDYLCNTFSFKL